MRLFLQNSSAFRPTAHKPLRPSLKKKGIALQVITNSTSNPHDTKSSHNHNHRHNNKDINHHSKRNHILNTTITTVQTAPMTRLHPRTVNAPDPNSATHLEIILLALTTASLVLLLALTLYLGVTRRRGQSPTNSTPYLWKKDTIEHHPLLLNTSTSTGNSSIKTGSGGGVGGDVKQEETETLRDRVRRLSEGVGAAVRRELRLLSAVRNAGKTPPRLGDVEGGFGVAAASVAARVPDDVSGVVEASGLDGGDGKGGGGGILWTGLEGGGEKMDGLGPFPSGGMGNGEWLFKRQPRRRYCGVGRPLRGCESECLV